MVAMFMAAGLVMLLMLIAHKAFSLPDPAEFRILLISNSCH